MLALRVQVAIEVLGVLIFEGGFNELVNVLMLLLAAKAVSRHSCPILQTLWTQGRFRCQQMVLGALVNITRIIL